MGLLSDSMTCDRPWSRLLQPLHLSLPSSSGTRSDLATSRNRKTAVKQSTNDGLPFVPSRLSSSCYLHLELAVCRSVVGSSCIFVSFRGRLVSPFIIPPTQSDILSLRAKLIQVTTAVHSLRQQALSVAKLVTRRHQGIGYKCEKARQIYICRLPAHEEVVRRCLQKL